MRRRGPDRSGTPADLVVLGFGNPGEKYELSRHNAGYWVVDELLARHDGRLRRVKREPLMSDTVRINDAIVVLARSTTFYNEVGMAAASLVRRHGIEDLQRFVVVHDELDLAVGRIKLKSGGGLAGNNGLKSLKAHLGTEEFTRIRVGIDRPPSERGGAGYVLSPPAKSEREPINEAVLRSADAIEYLATNELTIAMNHFNTRN